MKVFKAFGWFLEGVGIAVGALNSESHLTTLFPQSFYPPLTLNFYHAQHYHRHHHHHQKYPQA